MVPGAGLLACCSELPGSTGADVVCELPGSTGADVVCVKRLWKGVHLESERT